MRKLWFITNRPCLVPEPTGKKKKYSFSPIIKKPRERFTELGQKGRKIMLVLVSWRASDQDLN